MSRRRPSRFAMAALLALLPAAAPAADAGGWLMMVKSHNTDPARAADFERWYNGIDIPDVLAVPGYDRARRGHAVAGDEGGNPPYVALYTISSADIDKTIIAMLMASWRMDQTGHGTDLIRVTERIYYQRAGKPIQGGAASKPTHLFLYRSDGAAAAAARGAVREGLASSATPYRLYQVLMHEPVKVPGRLVLFELTAPSDADAAEMVRSIEKRMGGAGGCGADCAALYRLTLDASG